MNWRQLAFVGTVSGITALTAMFAIDIFSWKPWNGHATMRLYFFGDYLDRKMAERLLPQQFSAARVLVHEYLVLRWIADRGEFASQVMLIAAFLGASSSLVTNRLRRGRAAARSNLLETADDGLSNAACSSSRTLSGSLDLKKEEETECAEHPNSLAYCERQTLNLKHQELAPVVE